MKINTLLGPRAHGSKERGAAAVEFAILIGLLALITGGIIEFGRVFWYYDALTKATRDGARVMSNWSEKTTICSSGGPAVRSVVINAANAAGVSPDLTDSSGCTGGNVDIQCTYLIGGTESAFGVCHNATSETDVPVNVNVAITGYSVTFGSWFAIPLPGGDWLLRPHTTMRYMN